MGVNKWTLDGTSEAVYLDKNIHFIDCRFLTSFIKKNFIIFFKLMVIPYVNEVPQTGVFKND